MAGSAECKAKRENFLPVDATFACELNEKHEECAETVYTRYIVCGACSDTPRWEIILATTTATAKTIIITIIIRGEDEIINCQRSQRNGPTGRLLRSHDCLGAHSPRPIETSANLSLCSTLVAGCVTT